jgi:hypothetical protein
LFPGRTSQPNLKGWFSFSERYTPMHLNGEVAVMALDRLAQQNDPFILTASFHNPHAPMIPALEYLNHYWDDRDNLFVSPSISDSGNNSAYFPENSLISWGYSDPDKVKEWTACYYAMIEQIDDYIGQMLDKLDEHGIADNTLIIFTSDHGEMLGAHASREKNKFVEESAHIPMMISFPGRVPTNTVVEEPVSQLDLFATILDYAGKSASDNGDGTSLRRFIEKTRYNETYDEEAVVSEWDFRKPLSATTLDRTLGGETNFLIRKGRYKLMMTKLASSTRLDMMYDIEADPYEVDNLVGNDGMVASDDVIGKAEHLKCLLVEWMERMDGPDNLYSDPVWNAGQGSGDIAEVTARRKWKTLNIWVSDTAVEVGLPVEVSEQLTRNEYIYLGRTTSGTLNVSSITVEGADASLIELSEFTSGSIAQGDHGRVKLTYRPTYYGQPIEDARVVIHHDAGNDKVIELSSVAFPNLRPTITSTPEITVDVGNAYSYTLTATDFETNALSYRSVTLPSWLNFNTNTAVLSGTPSIDEIGANPVALRVSDLYGSTDQSFTVWVGTAGNDDPVITSSPDTGVVENKAYRYIFSAVDVDADDLTFAAPTTPAWLSFNSTTRLLSGTPASTNVGLHRVALTASDGTVTVTQQFNIAVFATPVPANLVQNPSFETGNGTGWLLNEMSVSSLQASHGTYSLNVVGDGVDNVRGNPRPSPDLSIQANTDYVLTFDLNYVSGTGACVVRLNNINNGSHVKSVTSSPTSGWVPKTASFNSGVNTTLRMELYVDGTPSADFVAYFDNFVIAKAGAVGNTGPVITSIPATHATEGGDYSYALTAADAEEDPLTFSKISIPDWLTFDSESGVLSGSPALADVGVHSVALQVSDGSGTDEQHFELRVAGLPTVGYNAWSQGWSVDIGEGTNDYDSDLRNNFYEYALNGDPTNQLNGGVDPTLESLNDSLVYIHLQRNDDPNLIYQVETSTNLVTGVWTNMGYAVLGTNSMGGGTFYDEVTNGIPVDVDEKFIRLKIMNP